MENDIILSSLRVSELEGIIQNSVKKALKEFTPPPSEQPQDELMTIEQAAKFLNKAVPTLYGLVHYKKIPNMKRQGRLYFSKQELLSWIQAGKRLTVEEMNHVAAKSLER